MEPAFPPLALTRLHELPAGEVFCRVRSGGRQGAQILTLREKGVETCAITSGRSKQPSRDLALLPGDVGSSGSRISV